MAIGFGDLVPYSQLPGAVAGQESMQAVQQVNAGATQAANAEKAQDEALTANMNTTLQQQKAPSALILSNLKDAQSINHLPIKASYDDLESAHEKVMSGSDKAPSPLEQKKIMALADEMAQSRAPKFDPNDPGAWYAQQKPDSNADMTIAKMQGQMDGRRAIADNNLDLRYLKEQDLQDYRASHENRADARTGVLAGAVGPNGTPVPRLAERKFSEQIYKNYENSRQGQVANIRTKDGQRSPMWDEASMMPPMIDAYTKIQNTGDYDSSLLFYNQHKADLDKAGYGPPKKPQARPQAPATRFGASNGPIGADQMMAGPEVPPPADAVFRGGSSDAARGPSEEGAPTVAKSLGGVNPDGSIDMPNEDESAQLRAAASRDIGQVADNVRGSAIYKGIASGLTGAATAIGGSGKPQPLLNEPRRTSPSGQEVQKYSDGKWYPVGATPGDNRGPAGGGQTQIVPVGNRVYRVGDVITLRSGVKYKVNADGSGDRVKDGR